MTSKTKWQIRLQSRRISSLLQILMFVTLVMAMAFATVSFAKKVYAFDDDSYTISESSEYVDGRVAIKYHKTGLFGLGKDLKLSGDIFSEFRETGVKLEKNNWLWSDEYIWYEAKINSGYNVQDVIKMLKRTKNIACIEPVYIRTSTDYEVVEPNDEYFGEQTYLDDINLGAAREFLAAHDVDPGGSSDVVVAVIDTGVDYRHEDLADSMWVNSGEIPGNGIDDDHNGYVDDYYGWSTYTDTGDPDDVNGHGTHVAGIIAASSNNSVGIQGIAYNTKIMAIQAASSAGVFKSTDIVEAIQYAYLNGADVINMSFGGTTYSVHEEDALQAAYSNCILIAAAGNDHLPNESYGVDFFPAAYESVIGVMASNGNVIASFSNYDYLEDDNHEYEICAPGYNILSTLPDNQYKKWSGTSMAAPVVSGVAALLRSYFTDKTYYNTRFITDQLTRTGDECIIPVNCITYHEMFSRINAYNALATAPVPQIKITNYYIFDDPDIDPMNDGDGVLDAGETAYIALEVKNNYGKAVNVRVSIDTLTQGGREDKFFTIISREIELADIGAGNTQSNGIVYDENGVIIGVKNPIIIKIDSETPNDSLIKINFNVTCNNGYDLTDENEYKYELYAPFYTRNGSEISGKLKEDTVLTNDRLWIIDSILTIPEGITLTIEEGTTVQFWTSDANSAYSDPVISKMIVRGNLIAKGTKDNPINFITCDFYKNYAIQISGDGGVIELTNVNIENPIITNARYIDSCYFTQNGEYVLTKQVYQGVASEVWSNPEVRAQEISNSVFYAIGDNPYYDWLRLYVSGKLYNNLFSSCRLNLDGSSEDVEGNVFNNSSRSDGTYLKTNIYIGYRNLNFAVVDGIKDESTGSGYLLVTATSYKIASRFAKYVGGYMASINNAKEQAFLESVSLASKRYYIGAEFDEKRADFIWADGSPINYNNFSNPTFIGHYVIMEGSDWSKVVSGTECSYYLIEVPANSIVDDFKFAQNELYLQEGAVDQKVDIILTPKTADINTLVYSSSDESVFVVDAKGSISAKATGDAVLTVKTNDNFVVHQINVHVIPETKISDITLTSEELDIPVGDSKKINAKITPNISTEKVVYTSLDPSIAEVDEFGNVKANSVGDTFIYVTNEDGSISKSVKVRSLVLIETLEYNESVIELLKGESIDMPAPSYTPANATINDFNYLTSDASVAYVNEEGKLVAASLGVCVIRAESKDGSELYSEITVTVVNEKTEEVKFTKVGRGYFNYSGNYNNYYYGLTTAGNVYIWGGGIKYPQLLPVSKVIDVAISNYTFMYLYKDGTVGTGIEGSKVSGLSNVIEIDSCDNSFIALTNIGEIYGWGNNSYGKLCTGDEDYVNSPYLIATLSNAVDVAMTYECIYILLDTGVVYYAGGYDNAMSGLQVYANIGSIKFFESYDSYVYAYGDKNYYQLYSTWYNTYETPTSAIVEPGKVSYVNNYNSLAYIDANGNVFGGNGYNRYGKFSSSNINQYNWGMYYQLNIKNASKVYNYDNNLFIIDKDGTLYGTGLNNNYQLADLSTTNRSNPTKLLFGLQGNDDRLQIVSTNAKGVLDLVKGFKLEFEFNDAINIGGTFNSIRLTTNEGKIVSSTKQVNFNKLVITLNEDIVNATSLTLSLPANCVLGKFTQAFNGTNYVIEVLNPINITGFNIDEENIDIYKGNDQALTITITVDGVEYVNDNNMNRYIVFTSSNPNVVNVDKYGKISALKGGSATITAQTYDGEIVDSVKVVVHVALDDITLRDNVLTLKENEEYALKYTYAPLDATDLSFVFASSNETVVTIAADGTLKALKEGNAIITISSNGIQKAMLVNVVKSDYVSEKVVKIVENNNSQRYALMDNGDVYTWSYSSPTPVLFAENVSDIFANRYNYSIITCYKDGLIKSNYTNTTIELDNIVDASFYYERALFITTDGSAYSVNFDSANIIKLNITNVKDVFVGGKYESSSPVGYVIDALGNLYSVDNSGDLTLDQDIANAKCFYRHIWDNMYVITTNNEMKRKYLYNNTSTWDDNTWSNTFASQYDIHSLYESEYYAYVNENGDLAYRYYYNGYKQGTISGYDIVSVYAFGSYGYFITSDGSLYGFGYNNNYAFTKMLDTYLDSPQKILVNVGEIEDNLVLTNTNMNSLHAFTKGTKIIYEYNQPIFLNNKSKINLVDANGKYASLNVSVEGSKLIIELNEDLVVDAQYTLTIRSEAIRTFLYQYNELVQSNFEPLEDIAVEAVTFSEDSVTVERGSTYQVNASITPDNLSNKYLVWMSSNNEVASVDRYGLVSTHSAGTVTISAYDFNDNLMDSIEITVIVSLEDIDVKDTILVLRVGESKEVEVIYTPSDSTNKATTYTSSNEEVATVSTDGTVKGLKEGNAIITINSNGMQDAMLVKVVKSDYVSEKIVKVVQNNNSQRYVLMDNGDVYTWNYSSPTPVLFAENVSDIFANRYSYNVITCYKDGLIKNTYTSNTIELDDVVDASFYYERALFITADGSAYSANFDSASLMKLKIVNAKDVYTCERSNMNSPVGYVIDSLGNLYNVEVDGTLTLVEDVTNARSFYNHSSGYIHIITNDNKIYSRYVHNDSSAWDNYQWANTFASQYDIHSLYDSEYYAYVDENGDLVYRYYYNGYKQGTISGYDIVSVYAFGSYGYFITSDGSLYGYGYNENYAFTKMLDTYLEYPQKILVNVGEIEDNLVLTNTNMNSLHAFTKGTKIVYEYNQPIFLNNKNKISLVNANGKYASLNVSVEGSKLIIELNEDLVIDAQYTLTIRSEAIRTFLYQYNELIQSNFEPLEDIAVEAVAFSEDSVTVERGNTYQVNASITPDNLSNKYLVWMSSNNEVASVDRYGLVSTHSAGTVTISAYDFNGNLMDSIEITVIVSLEDIDVKDTILVLRVGESKEVEVIYTPADSTNKATTYTSSNEEVATVSTDGTVKGLKEGNAIITVNSNGMQEALLVLVKPSYYEDENVIDIAYTNSRAYALMDNGNVYAWGNGNQTPEKYAENVYKIYGRTQNNYLLLCYNDGTVKDMNRSRNINLNNVSKMSYYDNYALFITEDAKTYLVNFNDETVTRLNINNAKEVCATWVRDNTSPVGYVIDTLGNLYSVEADGTLTIVQDVTNAKCFYEYSWDYVRLFTNNGYMYSKYLYNNENTWEYYQWSNTFASQYEINSLYESDCYAYVNENCDLVYKYYYNGAKEGTISGYDIKQVFCYNNFIMFITSDNRVYGFGYNNYYVLTKFANTFEANPVRIYVGVDVTEDMLQVNTSNVNSIRTFSKDTELVYEFNQPIFLNNKAKISLVSANGDYVDFDVRVDNNKLILKLNEDLVFDAEYTLTIRSEAVRTFLYQYNYLTQETIVSLSANNPTAVHLTDTDVNLSIHDQYKIELTIEPEELNYNYIRFVSSDETKVRVDREGNLTLLDGGEAKVYVYDLDEHLLATLNLTIYVPLENFTLQENIVVVKVGETAKIDVNYFPANATTKSVTYNSSDAELATVSADGTVTAKASGLVIITIHNEECNLSQDMLVSVVSSDYEAEKVVKVSNAQNNGGMIALTNMGNIYVWGRINSYLFKQAVKLNVSNVKDFDIDFDSRRVSVVYNDGTVGINLYAYNNNSSATLVSGLNNIRKVARECNEFTLALSNDGKAYVIDNNANVTQLGTFSNVVDIDAIDGGMYLLLGTGQVVYATSTSDYALMTLPVSIKGFSEATNWSHVYALGINNVMYRLWSNNYEAVGEAKVSDASLISYNNQSWGTYLYIKDNKVYNQYDELINIQGKPVDLWVSTNDTYYIVTEEGELYAYGNNNNYELTSAYASYVYTPVKLNVSGYGNSEKSLNVSKTNIGGAHEYVSGDQIVIEFNQHIYESSNFNSISVYSSASIITATKEIDNNKIIITLLEDLVYGTQYTVSIPNNAVKTYLDQTNTQTSYSLTSLKYIDITDLGLESNALEMLKGSEETINVLITPNTATNRYLNFVSSNTDVVTVNEFGALKAIGNGTAQITISYQDLSVALNVTVFETISELKVKDSILVGGVGEELDFDYTYNYPSATRYDFEVYSSDEAICKMVDGKIKLLSTGLASISVRDKVTGLVSSTLVLVSENSANSYKVKKVLNGNNQRYYFALMEDGSMWVWGQFFNMPKNITSLIGVDKKVIDFYTNSNERIVFLFEDNSAKYAYYNYSNNSFYLDMYSYNYTNVTKVDFGKNDWYEPAILSNGKLYNVNENTQISNLSNIVDFDRYDNGWYLLTDKGLVYYYYNGSLDQVKNLSNIMAFVKSQYPVHAIATDGTVYYIYDGAVQGTLSENFLDRYENIRFIDSYYYYGVKDGVMISNYLSTENSLNNLQSMFYYNERYYYITTDGDLYVKGNNNYNLYTGLYKDDDYYDLHKIYFGIDGNGLLVDSTNIAGIKEYKANDELIIRFNQAIYESTFSISLYDSSNVLVDTEISIDKNELHIKLLEDLILDETYTLEVLSGSFETILGELNENISYRFECGINHDDVSFVINGLQEQNNMFVLDMNASFNKALDITLEDNVDVKYLLFASSDSSVASINSRGVLSANKAGDAIITISNNDGSCVKTIAVHVSQAITSLTIANNVKSVSVDEQTYQVPLTISPKDYNNSNITWKSSNEDIATVDSEGLVTLKTTGIVAIGVNDSVSGLSASIILFVNDLDANEFKVKDVKISSYASMTYYLMQNGDVWAKYCDTKKPQKLSNLENIVQIASGSEYLMALSDAGEVYIVYHYESYGKVNGLTNIKEIQMDSTCQAFYALDTNDVLWAWGASERGRLGFKDPNGSYYSTPMSVYANPDDKLVDFRGSEGGLVILTESGSLYYSNSSTDGLTRLEGYGQIERIIKYDDCYENYGDKFIVFETSDEEYYKMRIDLLDIYRIDSSWYSYFEEPTYQFGHNSDNGLYYKDNLVYAFGFSQSYFGNLSGSMSNPYVFELNLKDNESIVRAYNTLRNIYVITSLGRLFVAGDNERYQLVNFTRNSSGVFSEISFAYNDEEVLTQEVNIENNATDVSVDSDIVITFNQPVLPYSIRRYTLTCNDALVASTVTVDLNKVIIHPNQALEYNANVVLNVEYSLVTTCNDQYSQNIYLTFTTEAAPSGQTSAVNTNDMRIVYNGEGYADLTEKFVNGKYVTNFYHNSILNDYSNTNMDTWIRIYTYEGEGKINIAHNYFGTSDLNMVNKVIVDMDIYAGYYDLEPSPILYTIPDSDVPYMTAFRLVDENGYEMPFAAAGQNFMEITFNTDMDTSQTLMAYFGPSYPYTDFLISGTWIDSRTWLGEFTVYTTTGDGLEHVLVMGATSASGFTMTKDFRYVFEISSIGAESLSLFAEARTDGVHLTWTGNDDELAVGYNIYRSYSADYGYNLINSTLINLENDTYIDKNVSSNTTYYYKIAIVYSDLSESVSDGYIDAKTVDVTLPTISHSPIYNIKEGSNLTINATCRDNNGVESVTLFYRESGTSEYKSKAMLVINSNNPSQYSASIYANEISLAGIQYYISVMDTEGNVTTYRSANSPVPVSVTKSADNNTLIINSLSIYNGHISGGDQLSINGENFTRDSIVYMGGEKVDATYVNSSLLRIITPRVEEAKKVTITVENPDGQTASKVSVFTYYDEIDESQEDENMSPKIYYLSETEGFNNGGYLVILYGNRFTENTKVFFGDNLAETIYISNMILYVYVPQYSSTGAVDVKVTDNGYSNIKYNAFTYKQYVSFESLIAFALSSKSGLTDGGSMVSLYGANFTEDMKVYFGGVEATYSFISSSQVLVTVPAHAEGKVDVKVTSTNGESTLSNAYEYVRVVEDTRIEIIAISSKTGLTDGGNYVNVYGAHFTEDMKVYFGGVEATYSFISTSQVLVTVPAHTEGKVDVKVTSTNGESTLTNAYEYVKVEIDNRPMIIGLSTTSGFTFGLSDLTVYGNNFTADMLVYVDGVKVTSYYISTTQVVITIPSHSAGKVDVKVENTLGYNVLESGFEYIEMHNYNVNIKAGVDTIYAGSTWIDAGITSDYPVTVRVIGSVNNYVSGRYVITYECYDASLLVATVYRVVNVIDNPYNVTISINAGLTTLEVGDEYYETGATSNAGTVTVYRNEVDTSKVGVYAVTYKVEYKGATYYKTKYVHVIAKTEGAE